MATADEDFVSDGSRFQGNVQIHGEIWRAISEKPVKARDKLNVVRRDGLTVNVEPPAPSAPVFSLGREQRKNIA